MSLAVVCALLASLVGARPAPVSPAMANVADSYDGFDAAAAEQLRQDQCLMAGALRVGGTSTVPVAQNALNQSPASLHTLADQEYWNGTPLSTAYEQDRDAIDATSDALVARLAAWQVPLSGLSYPYNFANNAEFYWPPGVPGTTADFFDQVGYGQWLGDQWWKDESDLYEDPTPVADDATVQAVKDLGTPLYGDPDPSLPTQDWQQAYAEHQAFEDLVDGYDPTGADDARMFLSAGGFPRTAPEPGSLEFRIAVEDLKSRFASCAWRDPIDPNRVLGQELATASAEWQQEIASQATQRNQIIAANTSATKALTTSAQALGEMLGQSWIADHLARWQDYWSAGGTGWIGDSPMAIHANGSSSRCLEVGGNSTADAAVVQIYTCNGGANQQWRISGDTLVNVNSGKCLVPKASGSANGTAMVQGSCAVSGTSANRWKYNPHATTPLTNIANGKCLNLPSFTNSQDATLSACTGGSPQKLDIVPAGHNGTGDLDYPTAAQFTKATKGVADAKAAAQAQLTLMQKQAQTAGIAATESDTYLASAYGISDQAGAPRGRGLLVGLQKAQVTKASASAINAMLAAAQTALSATKASAADSATIAALAVTQAAATTAAFRNAAAEAAKNQAKAAADAAAVQAGNAKTARDTAKAKLAVAQQAEADAKAAAATAHARRLDAEAEEATAKAEKETAAQKQAEAAQHKNNAQEYAGQAETAKGKAEAADATATQKRKDAESAADKAKDLRDDAWDAEQKADAARAKADAKGAYAQAEESESDAQDARDAADQADTAADAAESAAVSARSEADAATQAAADADAAATRAEAAAKRAHTDADAARAAKLKADAAVATATSAAADAITASKAAATAASAAVRLADEAEAHAADAKTQADAANTAALTAISGANTAAGHAYTAAQASVDAGNAALQVAAPANDAVQLGAPYVTTDSAAGLAVLTGQSAKTIAEQQRAVAEAHAQNAQAAAAQAASTANAATGDAKAAYTLAAEAAGYAADARNSAKAALGYAAEAAGYASQAAQSLSRTVAYDNQATADAQAADEAAGRADGYAQQARDSADTAALDAEAARSAAAQAEQAAEDARAAADDADAQATAAEEAAKNAQAYAESAQQAADEAERAANAQQIATGTVPDDTGALIGGMFYVVDHYENIGEPQVLSKTDGCDGWIDKLFYNGDCTITAKIRYQALLDVYMCTAEGGSQYTCPAADTVYLGLFPSDEMTEEVTHTITIGEYQEGVDPIDILFGSWIKCAQKVVPGGASGSGVGCAWAALDVAAMFAGKIMRTLGDAVRAVDASARTGIGFVDAWRGLRAAGLPESAVTGIAAKVFQKLKAACLKDSFPAGTPVLLADGASKPIEEIGVGDKVLATDPSADITRSASVTGTLSHPADRLLLITLADGGQIRTTPGHRLWSPGRGWVQASELRVGDPLRTASGTSDGIVGIGPVVAPQTVWDLSVADLHTFYVLAGATPVLVHNVNCPDYVDVYPSGRGVVAGLDEEGIMTLAIEAGADTPRGGEMFNAALAHFGDAVKGVKGYWQDGGTLIDNLDSFNAAVRGGATLEEAALATFTGKMASRAGFTRVEMVELRGMPGAYTEVGALFH
ncbi:RICIN domain-containing protein [Streptomyces sp. NBC_00247]|uniref:RICIN domain-containing protein n=1 Tax=Streptomyces sp. NBC_00247 TaxID=2975689 RepID=UPI002E2AF88D|nr:ricin-type beta-trefoil lectin domain protein [Streptomyces sp. NBC_00247]